MFLSSGDSVPLMLPPDSCTFDQADWEILAGFWHPVAFAKDIQHEAVSARLLDVDLVIFRGSGGLSVALDQCPHRGTKLSMGTIVDDQLVCPMHGLSFDSDGQCVSVPSNVSVDLGISPKMQLKTVSADERYGIVWVNLTGSPRWPLPVWPGIKDESLRNLYIPSDTWNASAPRHVENFNDIAHFPWVHAQTFGAETVDSVPLYEVHDTDFGLSFEVPYLEGGNRFPDGVDGETRQVTYCYELTFPFSTLIIISPDDSDYVQYFADTVCPVSAFETKIFQVVTDTTGSPDADFLMKESLMVNDEDKMLVESQRPKALPLNLHAEAHIPADRMSIRYRRALSEKFKLGCSNY